jgi:hypothetical protein
MDSGLKHKQNDSVLLTCNGQKRDKKTRITAGLE